MTDLDEGDRTLIENGICPLCSHRGFRLGPRGGLAQNIYCMGCNEGFNVIGRGFDIMFAERIGKFDPPPEGVVVIDYPPPKGTHS